MENGSDFDDIDLSEKEIDELVDRKVRMQAKLRRYDRALDIIRKRRVKLWRLLVKHIDAHDKKADRYKVKA